MKRPKPLVNRGVISLAALLLFATLCTQILNMQPAFAADDGGYPWIGATQLNARTSDYGYYPSCPSNASSCMSIPHNYNGHTYGEMDAYGYVFRNCTSYVAWKIKQVFPSVSFPSNLGDASTWASMAQTDHFGTVYASSGYTPQIGDIAVWTGADHVAYVYYADPTTHIASLDEYNVGLDGNFYSSRTTASNSAGTPDYYIHVGTVTPPPDTDGDGVPDSSDWCPIVAGNPVNNGCPNDVIQVSGDVNGDGKKDIIDISRNTDNSPVISWFPSTSTATTASVSDPQSGGVTLPAPSWNVDHLKWTVGDFNGDGKDDLFVVSGSATDPPVMYILLSNGSGFNAPQLVKQPNPAYWQWPRLEFLAGDFNGDGKADLFACSGSSTDPPVLYIFLAGASGSLNNPTLVYQPNPAYWQWLRLQF